MIDIIISDIETDLERNFLSISKNLYFDSVPNKESIPDNVNDFCVVDMSNGIDDLCAYGFGTFLLWLYARPFKSGNKNVPVMSELEKNLNTMLNNFISDKYQIRKRSTYTDFDKELRWHCNIVELKLIII